MTGDRLFTRNHDIISIKQKKKIKKKTETMTLIQNLLGFLTVINGGLNRTFKLPKNTLLHF